MTETVRSWHCADRHSFPNADSRGGTCLGRAHNLVLVLTCLRTKKRQLLGSLLVPRPDCPAESLRPAPFAGTGAAQYHRIPSDARPSMTRASTHSSPITHSPMRSAHTTLAPETLPGLRPGACLSNGREADGPTGQAAFRMARSWADVSGTRQRRLATSEGPARILLLGGTGRRNGDGETEGRSA